MGHPAYLNSYKNKKQPLLYLGCLMDTALVFLHIPPLCGIKYNTPLGLIGQFKSMYNICAILRVDIGQCGISSMSQLSNLRCAFNKLNLKAVYRV